jgi:hypothetical protein
MKTKTFAFAMAIFCICAGSAWPQKSINDVYKMNVIVHAATISPETTSMLYINQSVDQFDGIKVSWGRLSSNNERRGVIIPSGVHTLGGEYGVQVETGRMVDALVIQGVKPYKIPETETVYRRASITFDFKPGGFYQIEISNRAFVITDLTNNVNWSNEKAQMMQLIQQNTTGQNTAGQSAQGSSGAARSGGIQGALDRAAKTVMPNLKQDDMVAIISFTAPDRDTAQFAQEELEVILVNNRFAVVDRGTLDKIRQEQKFQLTEDVDDKTAVSIGKFAGARVVMTGSVSGSGDLRRLRLRALDTQTARVLGSASEAF